MPTTAAPPDLVLASGSPRRREILTALGIPFRSVPVSIDETPRPGEPAPDTAARLARAKAEAGRAAGEGAWVLGADTLVAVDGATLGKPQTPEEAAAMLSRLAGRSHRVTTAAALIRDGQVFAGVDHTTVWIRPLTTDEIAAYVATGEPMDRAGAYAAQGRGAALVDRIDGDFFCVIGLSVRLLVDLLGRTGLTRTLWSSRPGSEA